MSPCLFPGGVTQCGTQLQEGRRISAGHQLLSIVRCTVHYQPTRLKPPQKVRLVELPAAVEDVLAHLTDLLSHSPLLLSASLHPRTSLHVSGEPSSPRCRPGARTALEDTRLCQSCCALVAYHIACRQYVRSVH